MKIVSRFAKPISYAMTTGMLVVTLHLPSARGDLIGTDAIVDTAQVQQERDYRNDTFNREAVKAKLLSSGVDSTQVQARVDALTENEAQTLAMHIDKLPAAGADTTTWLLIIILLILIL
jgi:hypothetical protein